MELGGGGELFPLLQGLQTEDEGPVPGEAGGPYVLGQSPALEGVGVQLKAEGLVYPHPMTSRALLARFLAERRP